MYQINLFMDSVLLFSIGEFILQLLVIYAVVRCLISIARWFDRH